MPASSVATMLCVSCKQHRQHEAYYLCKYVEPQTINSHRTAVQKGRYCGGCSGRGWRMYLHSIRAVHALLQRHTPPSPA
jgi:hypothetical protein